MNGVHLGPGSVLRAPFLGQPVLSFLQRSVIAQPGPSSEGTEAGLASPSSLVPPTRPRLLRDPASPEAHPPACLLGQGLGDGVKVGFAAEESMQEDEGREGRLPVQKLVGKRHRPKGRSKDGGRF